jgi:uncharacterized protein
MRGIKVGNSPRGGRGVFATRPFQPGEVIEVCPLIVGPEEGWGESTADYVFQLGPNSMCLALGYGSLYNHGTPPNATYTQTSKHAFTFIADRPIRAGEEILVSYGPSWWTSRDRVPR